MHIKQVYRIVTFLPDGPDYIKPEAFIERLNEQLPIEYGNYDRVAYYSEGTEQFRPLKNSHPTSGSEGVLSKLKSIRVEFSVPYEEEILARCLKLIRELHAWEEPVTQIYTCQETVSKENF